MADQLPAGGLAAGAAGLTSLATVVAACGCH
jgi:hypothetical protein